MNAHQQTNTQTPVENEDQVQQEQINALNKFLDILHWFRNETYNFLLPGIKCAVQFIRYCVKLFFQSLFFIISVLGVIHVIWEYIVKMLIYSLICQSFFGFIPGMSNVCELLSANSKSSSITMTLPIDSVIEKTVAIAEQLSETDVSAPIKITEIGISLIDLKTNVMFSEIEQSIKNQLIENIDNMRDAASVTADEIRHMVAAFNSALGKIEVYIKHLHKVLTKEKGNKIGSKFEEFLEHVENEIERIILLANDVHSKLVDLERKPDVLIEIISEVYQIEREKLDKIEHDSYISQFYRATIGKGNIDKAKHQRNLQVFNKFPEFAESAAISIKNVIGHLRNFKHEIEEVKYTVSQMDRAQTLEVDSHIEILNNALESLQKYRKQFDRRINDSNKNLKQISN